MNVIYAILSIAGWTWCIVAAAYFFFRRRRTQ
jgi:hypothetical protein